MGYGGFKQKLFPAQVLRNLFYKRLILHLTTGYSSFRRARFLDQNSYSIWFGFCQPIVTHRIARLTSSRALRRQNSLAA